MELVRFIEVNGKEGNINKVVSCGTLESWLQIANG